jgi:hypothetical protein
MLKNYDVTVRCSSGYTTVLTVQATDAVAACKQAKRVFQASDDYTAADPVVSLVAETGLGSRVNLALQRNPRKWQGGGSR